jgi:hypothetical protein
MREIVTLQFGERSNYLGTHFWNTQVSASCPRPAQIASDSPLSYPNATVY